MLQVSGVPHLAENLESRQDPPRVANIRLLLRPTVQPARVALPLAKPPAQKTYYM